MLYINIQYFGGRGGGGSGGARGGRAGGGGGGTAKATEQKASATPEAPKPTSMPKTPNQFRQLSKSRMVETLEAAGEGSTITVRVKYTSRDLAGNILNEGMKNKTYYKDSKGWYAPGTKWGLNMDVVNTKRRVSSSDLADRLKNRTVNGISLK